MPYDPTRETKRPLARDERIAEVLFGLIMVTTFTGSLSIADAGRDDVRAMLIGALGCNLAWGIIDAVMYLMGCLADKGRGLLTYRALRRAADQETARRIIGDALPPVVTSILQPAELDSIRDRLVKLPEPPNFVRLGRTDWYGAIGVFLLVFFATLPVTIPFLLMDRTGPAMRVSNLIAITMLFGLGYAFGRCVARNPWLYAVTMVFLGGALVALTMALGG